jgi:hypothetical protein
MAFFSEYQFDLLYRPGQQMQVPEALRRKPRTEEDVFDLLRTKEGMQSHQWKYKSPQKRVNFKKGCLHFIQTLWLRLKEFPEVS